ncbi:7e6a8969-5b3e-402e-84ea-f535d82c0616 [Sclerotinia trifoliorum]|uniref:7e6a8969-5b3e-402e-84ea-f535d82c0616 n=1 Tax=Sclerotinia trifoliorum TaxID=28548 RepID=A0A8H2ZUY7_9HELO|nr:7e6a8969-5b3e-402e-84ea-f535d82c0616 [Sclerotinia trifoliorum]
MKPSSFFLALCAYILPIAAAITEETDTATIYIQPLVSDSAYPLQPSTYPSTLSASLVSYEPPVDLLPPHLPRLPLENLALTGIRCPNLRAVLGVTIKSGVIDAGATRDFAPKVEVRRMVAGKEPVLGPNVVLSKEGKLEGEVVEKTFLQKYWWILLGAAMLTMTAGGSE